MDDIVSLKPLLVLSLMQAWAQRADRLQKHFKQIQNNPLVHDEYKAEVLADFNKAAFNYKYFELQMMSGR